MTTREILPPPESTYQLLLDAARAWPDAVATQWIPDPGRLHPPPGLDLR